MIKLLALGSLLLSITVQAAAVSIEIPRGDRATFTFPVTDASTQAVDITGWTLSLAIRPSLTGATLTNYTHTAGAEGTNGSLVWTYDVALAPGRYLVGFSWTTDEGAVFTPLARAPFTVLPSLTSPASGETVAGASPAAGGEPRNWIFTTAVDPTAGRLLSLAVNVGLRGPAGPTGASGTNGVNGSPGPAGTNGVNGAPGPAGTNGVNGAPGVNGTNGVNGVNGTNGVNGVNGTNGVNGAPGVNGTNGVNGVNGTNGVNGISPDGLSTNWILYSVGPAGSGVRSNVVCFVDGVLVALTNQISYVAEFSPTNTSNLIVWLDGGYSASRLTDSGAVTGWVDRVSGVLYSQATSSQAPADDAAGPDFDGVDDYLIVQSDINPTDNSTALSVFIAATQHPPVEGTTHGFAYYESSDNAGWSEIDESETIVAYPGFGRPTRLSQLSGTGWAGWDVAADDFRVVGYESSASVYRYWVNGTTVLDETANFDDGVAGWHTIACNSYNGGISGAYSFAQIHEILIYNTVLSQADREAVYTYLTNRWNP